MSLPKTKKASSLYVQHYSVMSWKNVFGTAIGLSLSNPGFEFRQGNEIVLFSKGKKSDRI
jgi:hypothetical protein